jgi:membrane protease YdiL (CAAX protease family)
MSVDSSRQSTTPRRWGIPAGVAITLVSVIATQPLAALAVGLYPALAGWSSARTNDWLVNSPFANFITILIFELFSLGVIALFVNRKRIAFTVATALRRIRWRDLGFGAAGFMAYLGLAMVILTVLPLLLPINADQEQAIGFDTTGNGLTMALAFLGLVVLPPIAEELIFRGFLYGTLRSNKVKAVWATLVTSLMFGALHLLGGTTNELLWIGFADTFVLSLVLCYVREETGSVWACIILHALKNGLVFLNLFVISSP